MICPDSLPILSGITDKNAKRRNLVFTSCLIPNTPLHFCITRTHTHTDREREREGERERERGSLGKKKTRKLINISQRNNVNRERIEKYKQKSGMFETGKRKKRT